MKKTTTTGLMLLLTAGLFFGQTPKTYNGNFNSTNFRGTSSYQYYEDNSQQRIFNGSFSFTTPANSVNIYGTFQNDLKNGQWKFIMTNVANTDLLMNYKITANVTGAFDKGNLNGAWTLSRTKIITFSNSGISSYYQLQLNALSYLFDGKTVDFKKSSTATETSNANFKNNHFTGTFNYSVNGGKSKVSGQFDDNGYFNGSWTITYYQDGILHFQTREYKNGVLLNIKNKDNSTGEVSTIYNSVEIGGQESVSVNDFFQNYNEVQNSSKVGNNYLKLSEGKSTKGDVPFLENAIAIWYNNSSLVNSSYAFEIERGGNMMTVYPEKIIIIDKEKTEKEKYEKEQKENEKKKLEEAQKEQLEKEEQERKNKIREFQNSDYGNLQEDIRKEFNVWLVKTNFETSTDFENRIKTQSDAKFNTILAEKIASAQKRMFSTKYAKLGNYNPDNETYILTWGKDESATISVSKQIAQTFFTTFNTRKGGFGQSVIYVIPTQLIMINNSWKVGEAVVLFDNYWSGADFTRNSSFKFSKENGNYYYEYDNYGVKKYKLEDIKTIQGETIEKTVFFYDLKTNKNENNQSLNFTYQDLNITLPK